MNFKKIMRSVEKNDFARVDGGEIISVRIRN